MTTERKVFYLLLAVGAIIFLPYIGAAIYMDGKFPAEYFTYPPLVAPEKAGFSMIMFIMIAISFAIVAALYLLPGLFGFKKLKLDHKPDSTRAKFPIWFWVGLILWGGTLILLWGKFSEPKWWLNWADLPLFWGFALVLDGIVYRRTGGKSIIGNSPQELLGIGVASISGWLIFEYLNFFVDDNWIYPFGNLIPDNEFTLYAVLGSSGLMPMSFEWYSLLTTFKKFNNRYKLGPKLNLAKWLKMALLIVSIAGLFVSGLYPDKLFFLLWLAPLIILTIVLERMKMWTPFAPMKDGNWSPMLIFALTYLIQGFLLEFWNYFSGVHEGGEMVLTYTPAYWTYSIPYVNVYHVFEMPVLGLLGYLPFGVYCWVWWIVFAYLLNIPTQFSKLNPVER